MAVAINNQIHPELIAPCGINCAVCKRYHPYDREYYELVHCLHRDVQVVVMALHAFSVDHPYDYGTQPECLT